MKDEFYDKNIILENHLVKLVPFDEMYDEQLRKIIYDEEIYYTVECKSEEEFQNYLIDTANQRNLQNSYPFIVIDKRTNEVAGSTRYGNLQFNNKRLEIGWTWYGEPFRGKGLNKACKFELLKYAFEDIGFRRVQFSADVRNIRSQKAIKKLGATKEGVFRANYIDAFGVSRDDAYFSIIHSEWHAIKQYIFKEFI
ncbi:GNAT family N-acetyltransferase [Salipaludibacillus sp. HK11]|uniref:GNAT family N-acetyltransferase n=1 Tax=Salipaludibacillus sp. HK11 TaxID=3394320 RepID=UPI0039FD980D